MNINSKRHQKLNESECSRRKRLKMNPEKAAGIKRRRSWLFGLLAAVILLTGCSVPSMVTKSEFDQIMEEAQFVPMEENGQVMQDETYSGYELPQKHRIVAEYSVSEDACEAGLLYEQTARELEAAKSRASGSSSFTTGTGEYERMQVSANGLFSIVVRNGRCLIFMEGPAEEKDQIVSLMKQAGAVS